MADEEAPRQLWIIRGVDGTTGVPLIRGPWRDHSVVTLDAGFQPPTIGARDLDSVRRVVEAALPTTGSGRREAVAREVNAFLNRMREGDIVLCTLPDSPAWSRTRTPRSWKPPKP